MCFIVWNKTCENTDKRHMGVGCAELSRLVCPSRQAMPPILCHKWLPRAGRWRRPPLSGARAELGRRSPVSLPAAKSEIRLFTSRPIYTMLGSQSVCPRSRSWLRLGYLASTCFGFHRGLAWNAGAGPGDRPDAGLRSPYFGFRSEPLPAR